MSLNRPTEFQSLDDLLYATYHEILENGISISSKRAPNIEITQFAATLLNPRIRTSMSLDRKLVKSKFAEFAWYLSKDEDKDFILPYIKAYDQEENDNNKILGAYGSKIFGSKDRKSQYERVIEQIEKRETTKQAYIAISDSENYKFRHEQFHSPPCTIGLHFYVRQAKLNLTVYMRSNDAYLGLPHDLFCFTMLQELVSLRTNTALGVYTHCATSMHIYETHQQKIKDYLNEGLHEPIEMPSMVDSSEQMLDLVSKEFDPKNNISNLSSLNDYWRDYSLFSIKHYNGDSHKSSWEKKFKEESMRLIATNSIAQ
jgi:thymidylate synthase